MTDTIDLLGRVKVRALLLIGAVFLAGGVGGVALDRLVLQPNMATLDRVGPPAGRPRGGPPPFALLTEGVPPFLESLGLTSQQRVQVRQVLAQVRPEVDSLTRLTLPRMRVLTDSVQRQLFAILTDEQRALLRRRGRGAGPN